MRSPSMALSIATPYARRPPPRRSLGYRLYAALHAHGCPGLGLWALLLLP